MLYVLSGLLKSNLRLSHKKYLGTYADSVGT